MNKIQEIISKEEAIPEYWAEIAKLDFACLLDDKIKQRNISYVELAEKAGISQSSIIRILGGETNFTIETITKLMFALNERINIKSEPFKIIHMDIEELFRHGIRVEFQQPEYEENSLNTINVK